MTDEELAHLKRLWAADAVQRGELLGPGATIRQLLAEVDAWRAIGQEVAKDGDPWLPAEGSMGYRCRFCRHWSAAGVPKDHTANCAWKQARAILGQ